MTKWKARIVSVFVIAFIAAMLGTATAFASPTDIDEPSEGTFIELEPPVVFTLDDVEPGDEPTTETPADTVKPADDATTVTPAEDITTQSTTGFWGTSNQCTWELKDTGELVIGAGLTSAQPMWDYPHDDYGTTYSNILADKGVSPASVTSITISQFVSSIGANAFQGFINLRSVIFGSPTTGTTLTSIGNGAFAGCTSLVNITLPGKLQAIGADAFKGCTGLASIGLPASLTSIGSNAFADCPSLSKAGSVNYAGTTAQWNSIQMGSGNDILDEGLQAKDVFTVTFHYNDGTSHPTPFATLTTGTNGRLTALPESNPFWPSHTFRGWFTETSGGVRITTAYTFKTDTDVYAQWYVGEDKYEITFYPNGQGAMINGSQMQVVKTTTDGYLTELPPDPTRAGYKFTGWWSTSSGSEGYEITSATLSSTPFDKATSFYARWQKLEASGNWVITYDANGGVLTDAPQMTTGEGDTLVQLAGDPTREGYNFLGWFTAATGGNQVIAKVTVFTRDTTLYAHWEAKPVDPDNPDNPDNPGNPDNPDTPTYKVVSGANSTFTAGGNGTIVMRADGDLAKFQALLVDGKELKRDTDYTVTSGSVIATIKNAYLSTLAAGKHTVTFRYNDGQATADFTVTKASDNGDKNDGNDNSGNNNDNSGNSNNDGNTNRPTSQVSDSTGDNGSESNGNGSGSANASGTGSGSPDTSDGAQTASVALVMLLALMGLVVSRNRRIRVMK